MTALTDDLMLKVASERHRPRDHHRRAHPLRRDLFLPLQPAERLSEFALSRKDPPVRVPQPRTCRPMEQDRAGRQGPARGGR